MSRTVLSHRRGGEFLLAAVAEDSECGCAGVAQRHCRREGDGEPVAPVGQLRPTAAAISTLGDLLSVLAQWLGAPGRADVPEMAMLGSPR